MGKAHRHRGERERVGGVPPGCMGVPQSSITGARSSIVGPKSSVAVALRCMGVPKSSVIGAKIFIIGVLSSVSELKAPFWSSEVQGQDKKGIKRCQASKIVKL